MVRPSDFGNSGFGFQLAGSMTGLNDVPGNLLLVDIDTGNIVAAFRETRTSDQADIAGPDNTNLHSTVS